MNKILSGSTGTVVLSEFTDGLNVVQGTTPLKYVNYFDGMLMRAELMKLEQQGHFNLSQLSNQAGGHGVIWGFDSALKNGSLNLGAGMAMDTSGQVVYMPGEIDLNIDDLINKGGSETTQKTTEKTADAGFADCIVNNASDTVTVIDGTQYYVITVGQIDALCGEEDVYGRLCEEACVTSTDRPYKIDGVVVRAEPLPSGMILPQSSAVTLSGSHLRSRIASAFYEYEQNTIKSHISGEGLAQSVWCNGARLPGGFTRGVPVGLLARQGSENLFLDRWIVTRERMEAPPRQYWAHMMAMRPWNTFLAQVLQFQCQLNGLFTPGGSGIPDDPCADTKGEIKDISEKLEEILNKSKVSEEIVGSLNGIAINSKSDIIYSQIENLQIQMNAVSQLSAPLTSSNLVSRGIIETPSAGYLPVAIDDSLSVDQQVRALMGEGVDLRFCVVRPDYIPHALEEAQHMERISLLDGLDNPDAKPKVDVLVPDGLFGKQESSIAGTAYEMELSTYEEGESLLGLLFAQSKGEGADKRTEEILIGGNEVNPNDNKALLEAVAAHEAARGHVIFAPMVSAAEEELPSTEDGIKYIGAARDYNTPAGGYGFFYAGLAKAESRDQSKITREKMLSNDEFLLTRSVAQYSVWISMSVDDNPMEIDVGKYCNASIEFDFSKAYENEQKNSRGKFNANARLKVVNSTTSYVDLEVLGSFTVTNGSVNRSFTHTARIERRDSGINPGILISVLTPNLIKNGVKFAMTRSWPEPTRARIEFGVITEKIETKNLSMKTLVVDSGVDFSALIATADQQVNPDVIKADHPVHIASLEALDAISLAAEQPELTVSRAQQLFDIDTAVSQSKQIYATLDWALFHRRRDKQCESNFSPIELLNRNYRVFTIKLKNEEMLGEVLELVESEDWQRLKRLGLELVTNVEFKGGTPNMVSTRPRVLSDWGTIANQNTQILYGAAINNPSWNEPSSLAESRIRQTNAVLDDETQISPEAQFSSMASLPPQVSGTADGAMLYVIHDQASTCQRVIRYHKDDNQDQKLEDFIAALSNASDFEKILVEFKLVEEEVGNLDFIGQSADTLNDDQLLRLQENWAAMGNGPISRSLSISRHDIDKADVIAQSDFVMQKLGGSSQEIDHVITPLDIGECWGVTVLFPGFTKSQAIYWYNGTASEAMLNMINLAVEKRGVDSVLNERWIEETSIKFDSEGELLNERDLLSLTGSITEKVKLEDNIEWRAISVMPHEVTADDITFLEKQSKVVLGSLNEDAEIISVTNISAELPRAANAITLMVPVDTSIDYSVIPVSIAKKDDSVTSSNPEVVFRFDADDELIKDEFFETQVKELKKLDIELSAAEMVGEKKPRSNDKRLNSLFEALKESEILKPDATKKTTKLKVEESSALDFGSFRLPEVLVLR